MIKIRYNCSDKLFLNWLWLFFLIDLTSWMLKFFFYWYYFIKSESLIIITQGYYNFSYEHSICNIQSCTINVLNFNSISPRVEILQMQLIDKKVIMLIIEFSIRRKIFHFHTNPTYIIYIIRMLIIFVTFLIFLVNLTQLLKIVCWLVTSPMLRDTEDWDTALYLLLPVDNWYNLVPKVSNVIKT